MKLNQHIQKNSFSQSCWLTGSGMDISFLPLHFAFS
jgi:hypothetical protein